MLAFASPAAFSRPRVLVARRVAICCDRGGEGYTTPGAEPRLSESRVITFLRDLSDTSGTAKFASRDANVVQDAWIRHRSRRRYARHLAGFPFSKLGRRLFPLSLIPLAESMSMYAYEQWAHVMPHFSSAPISYMSGIVGLLLAFRTNASLARYYEARGSWATIRSRSTDLGRMAFQYMNSAANATSLATARPGEKLKHQLARYLVSYGHVLVSHLEAADEETSMARVRHLLDDQELKFMMQASHRPNAVLQMITHVASDGDTDHHIRYKMDNSMTVMMDATMTLEKLLRTPIPLSYTRHTSRACLLWCFYVPLSLYQPMGGPIGCGIASACITFLLLGVEDIGVAVEDPIRLLPLREICESIEKDVFQMEDMASTLALGMPDKSLQFH